MLRVLLLYVFYYLIEGGTFHEKILGAIVGFFVAIWRWIKETAWVQPLLIVGIIFGIIFAIPSVVDGIRKIDERNNSAEKYYQQFQVSLAGAENSAADKLLDEIKQNSEGGSESLKGQKFFVVFVQKMKHAVHVLMLVKALNI